MTACTRFASEGFVEWEEGRPADAHVLSCPDCLARRRAVERMAVSLRTAPPGDVPPADWRARVLAAVDSAPQAASSAARAARAQRPARRRLLWAVPLVAAAAAIVLLVRAPRDLPAPQVAWTIVPADDRRIRGAPAPDDSAREAAPGDRLKVWGPVPDGARFEVRVFRGAELVFRCPPGCGPQAGRLEVDVPLAGAGRYEAFLAVSRAALPDPAASGRAEDIARITAAGGRIAEVPPITVR